MMQQATAIVILLLFALIHWGCGGCEGEKKGAGAGGREAREMAAEEPLPDMDEELEELGIAEIAVPTLPEDIGDCFVFVDADPDFGEAPLKTSFTVELECGNKPVTYQWRFGDDSDGSTEPNPVHVYEEPGDYIAQVTATTADGDRGSDEIDIFVDPPRD